MVSGRIEILRFFVTSFFSIEWGCVVARALTIWFTGLSCSGKTTLAQGLRVRLEGVGTIVQVLDGDEVRRRLSPGLGFTKQDRDTNIQRIGQMANVLSQNGITVVVAAVSPYRIARDLVRNEIGRFVEVYCRCPISVAERRDLKGLYMRARRGEITSVAGIDAPYEEPLTPEVVADTDVETIEESLNKIWAKLQEIGQL